MIIHTNPRKFFTWRCRKKTKNSLAIASLIYRRLPEAVIIAALFVCGICNLFDFLHERVEVATVLTEFR
jgi:hypothetical protein